MIIKHFIGYCHLISQHVAPHATLPYLRLGDDRGAYLDLVGPTNLLLPSLRV